MMQKPNWTMKVPIEMTTFLTNLLTEKVSHSSQSRNKSRYVNLQDYARSSERVMRRIDGHVLNSAKVIVYVVKTICETFPEKRSAFQKSEEADKTVLPRKNRLFKEIMTQRKLPLSGIEIRDLEQEMVRILHLHQLYRFYPYKSRLIVSGKFEQAQTILDSLQSYTATEQRKCAEQLEELEELCKTGLGIPEVERLDVLKALGMGKGHWFKCPNGHIYAIGDCGGAMETSTCNECGAAIGGQSHALLQDNALASEMDGADVAAWPNTLQQLNNIPDYF